MISEDKLIAHLSGEMTGIERAEFEDRLAADVVALRQWLDHERLEAALWMIEGRAADRERVRRSILEVVSGSSAMEVKQAVLLELQRSRDAAPVLPLAKPRSATAGGLLMLPGMFRRWLSKDMGVVLVPAVALFVLHCVISYLLPEPNPADSAASGSNSVPARVAATGSVTNPPAGARDPARWPFASDSVWNTPIGAGAQFASVQPGGLDLATGVMVVDAGISHPVFLASTNDPPGNLFEGGSTVPFASVPFPANLLSRAPGRGNAMLILPDGTTVLELQNPRREGNDLRANRIVRGDLRGPGIPPDFNSSTGSGLTPLAGSIRLGELAGGIPHVVGSVVPVEAVTLKSDGSAHVWPAARSHASDPDAAGRMARAGNIHVGTLLAIPPGVDIQRLATPGTPAFALVRAMQDYGVLVKDTFDGTYFTEWQREGSPNLIFCVEDLFNGDAPPDLARQLAPAIRELRVVTNHGPQSPGGGGAPRRAAPPALGTP